MLQEVSVSLERWRHNSSNEQFWVGRPIYSFVIFGSMKQSINTHRARENNWPLEVIVRNGKQSSS